MLPRDLIERYGWPVVTVVSVGLGKPKRIVDRAADRYCFAVTTQTIGLGITPDVQVDGTLNRFNLTIDTLNIFHQLTHGTLVNLGWSVSGVVAGTLTTFECFAHKRRNSVLLPQIPIAPNTSRRKRKATTSIDKLINLQRMPKNR